jgi:hypothetical protein
MKKTKKYAGGHKVHPGERQAEAHTGRKQNQQHKVNFKSGAFVKNDPNAGRQTPLVKANQVAVPPKEAADE